MNFQQLTTFCKVISEGSMTAAAEKLFLTQPAVSQQIRSLEDELNVPLLVRGVRQIKPTMQGQLLFDYAKKILHMTHQAEVALQTISQEISGHLRIATSNSLGLYLISPVVGLFLKHNTNLSIKLVYGSVSQIIDDMKKGLVDIAVLPNLREEYGIQFDDFEEHFLMKDEMWMVGSGRDTGLPNKIQLSQFNQRPVVLHSNIYPGFRRYLNKELAEVGITTVNPVFESDNVGTLKRVLESGLGWGFMPSYSIRKQVRARRLTQIQVDKIAYSVDINCYNLRNREVQVKAEVLYRALQQQALP